MEYFSRNVETGIQRMCESVFVALCKIVGTSIQVAIRRETVDIAEMVRKRAQDKNYFREMMSGSMREGFRLDGSDNDFMFWTNNHQVIWELSQSELYNTYNKTLILSDNSESPPGFTLLELLTPSTDRRVRLACVQKNDRVYISSSLYREQTRSLAYPDSTEHGPCDSGDVRGQEYDFAYCFVCDFWPPLASSWIDRCRIWPDKDVVYEIIRKGCHFVPIGNPLGLLGHVHEEWRISFSLAEHKLVHTMDHCQFLTYGLLKIFLKEVINKHSDESSKLLCSYHMKTAVFWVIQQNAITLWCPQNLLMGFWVCFKLLLKWVYEGVCPNFFIPQNNLFLSKVHGSAQRRLFLQLHCLYKKGLACLLQSTSIRYYITDILYNPRLSICTNEARMISESDHDNELFREVWKNDSLFPKNQQSCVKYLLTIEQLIESPLTQYQVVMLQRLTANILGDSGFILHNMYSDTGLNKQMYFSDKKSIHMLKLAVKFGCISDLLHIAMYYYKKHRYWRALSIIENMKIRLAQPYTMYLMFRGHVDPESYTEALGGQSWSTKMRHTVTTDIVLNSSICFIKELTLEQQSALQNNREVLCIPLFVVLHFVEFLCFRHTDVALAHTALHNLQVLVQYDHGLFIREVYKDVSWQVLGICQQMTGNLQAALYSYQRSLQQFPCNRIQAATMRRIEGLYAN